MRRTPPAFPLGLALILLSSPGASSCAAPDASPVEVAETASDAQDADTAGPDVVDPFALTYLHVADGALVDETGRQWLLRGVNAKYEHLFDVTFDDGRIRNEGLPEFADWDAPETARLGYDFVRLAINWSGLEPVEGQFDPDFLVLLDQVVDAYVAAGVYVLIDFHQDAWSKEIGEDGAPYWAIVPPPPEKLGGPLFPEAGLQCPCGDLNARRSSPVTLNAFKSFFLNKEGIRDRFVPAWQLVAGRYADRRGVVGFEAMNEPIAFHVGDGFTPLDDFHVAMAAALRQVNPHHAYFLEPENGYRAVKCASKPRPEPFPDPNVVYSPHGYLGACQNVPKDMVTYDDHVQGLAPVFDAMIEEAATYGAATVINEYWLQMGNDGMFAFMDAFVRLADQRNIGLAHWYWRGVTGNDNPECAGSGTVYCLRGDGEWAFMETGALHLSRPYPVAVPGRLTQHDLDRATGRLTVRFAAKGGEAAPLVYLPAHVFPSGADVTVDGAPVEVVVDSTTLRAALPWSGAPGDHEIVVVPRQP